MCGLLRRFIPTGVLFDLLCPEPQRPWNLTVWSFFSHCLPSVTRNRVFTIDILGFAVCAKDSMDSVWHVPRIQWTMNGMLLSVKRCEQGNCVPHV